jgi:hypothetical protein
MSHVIEHNLDHEHGWGLNLSCPVCGWTGVPKYTGDAAVGASMHMPTETVVSANLACYECGNDMGDAAKEKLSEMFKSVPIDKRGASLAGILMLALVLLPFVAFVVVAIGIKLGFWDRSAYLIIAALPLLIVPGFFLASSINASISLQCECGDDFSYMGKYENSYCYRCTSCGKLTRIDQANV